MSAPTNVLSSIKTALRESALVSSAATIVVSEVDEEGAQSALVPPVIEITPGPMERVYQHNTDFRGYVTDDAGNQIGQFFRINFELPVEIDAWIQDGSGYDEREFGEQIRAALYQYDDGMLGDPLPDPENPDEPASYINDFEIDGGQQANDLTMTPALRRWRTTGTVVFEETVDTTDLVGSAPYVESVVSSDGTVIASQDESEVEGMSVTAVVDDQLQFDT